MFLRNYKKAFGWINIVGPDFNPVLICENVKKINPTDFEFVGFFVFDLN